MITKIPSHRLEGAFLGLAIGDAYGRTLEFVSGEAVQQNTVLIDVNTFMWSEETHISLYIADAVLQMPQSKFDAEQFGHLVGTYLSTWLDDPLMPSTNPGNTTIAGVQNYKSIRDWKLSGVKTGDGSAAITRLCPIALAYDGTVLDVAAQVAAQITHAHPNALASAFATVRLLRIALQTGSLTAKHIEMVASDILAEFDAPEVVLSLQAAITESQRSDLNWLDDASLPLTDQGWRSPSTLGLALIATLKWHDDIATAIEKAARISGDSDAVASIAGMFLGAIHGVTKLPSTWLAALPAREDIRKKAQKLNKVVNQEFINIADKIRYLHTNGASISTANLQTNTMQISVSISEEALVTELRSLATAIGELCQETESSISIVIDRTLVPNEVRHAISMHLPKPEGLQPQRTLPSTSPNVRTSISHPIGVDWVAKDVGVGKGALGCTFAPGKKQPHPMTGAAWERDLNLDLDRLASYYKCKGLVSLVEDWELEKLQIVDLVEEAQNRNIAIYRSAIPDGNTPTLEQAHGVVQFAKALSESGHNVVFHCKGGLGRAGTLCACTLVALGVNPAAAIQQTRENRKGAIENLHQEKFVHEFHAFYHKK